MCCFICWCRRLIGVACLCYGYVRTNNHDVISAIINARNYEREWERKHGLYARPLRELCRREVNEWAIVQHVHFSLSRIGINPCELLCSCSLIH